MDANSIRNKTFVKSRHMGDEVTAYLQEVAHAFEDLERKSMEQEQNLATLAQKLQEYREDEDNLRNTLLHAQRLSDSVIKEAKQKAEIIMKDATIKSEALMSTTQTRIDQKEDQFKALQKEVTDFKNDVLLLYKQHLELITSLPEAEFEDEPMDGEMMLDENVDAPMEEGDLGEPMETEPYVEGAEMPQEEVPQEEGTMYDFSTMEEAPQEEPTSVE